MLDTTTHDQPLASAQDLANYHARRERFYATAAMLLTMAPDRLLLASARCFARGGRAATELAAALNDERRHGAEAEHELLFSGDAPVIDRRCHDPAAASRIEVSEQGMLELAPDIAAELRALAILADRTADAIEAGEMTEAATLCELQARFLRHAGPCAGRLAADLAAAGAPFYAALGRSLHEQLDEDMRLLAAIDEAAT